jgi:UrcA family protein
MSTFTITSRMVRSTAFAAIVGSACFVAQAADTGTAGSAASKSNDNKGFIITRTVRYSDLNLTVHSDAVRLYRRLDRAARFVCGGNVQPLALRTPRFKKCHTQAIVDAINEVNAPILTAYYEQKGEAFKAALKTNANALAADRS